MLMEKVTENSYTLIQLKLHVNTTIQKIKPTVEDTH